MNRKAIAALAVFSVLMWARVMSVEGAAEQGKALFAASPGESPRPVGCIALSLSPEGAAEMVAVKDILTAHLFQAGLRAVSDETILRARDATLRKMEAAMEQNEEPAPAKEAKEASAKAGKEPSAKPAKKADLPLIDGLAVVKEAGADCLIKITLIAQAVQQNVYDKENRRVVEVRTESRVSLVTASIVDVNGNILKVGSIVYTDPVPVATAAADLGQALVHQLARK